LNIPVLKNLQNLDFKFNDVVSISNLSYQYADKNDFAIRNLEFEIKKGQFIGLVGKTGSGKSTLLQILARQLNIHQGNYKLDGIILFSI
jgi:ABC-type bacteriocin/lantibiotic exporter with double-glycine peptidase domain